MGPFDQQANGANGPAPQARGAGEADRAASVGGHGASRASVRWPGPLPLLAGTRMVEMLILSAVINLLVLAVPIFVLQVYDRVVFHAGITTLTGLVIGMAAVIAFDLMFRQTRSRLMQRSALRVEVELADRLQRKIDRLPLRTLEERPLGYWQSIFRDVETVRSAYAGPAAVLLVDLPFAVLFLAAIWLIATPIAWIVTLALPLFVLLTLVSSYRLNRLQAEEKKATMGRDAYVGEMLAGRRAVKSMALGPALRLPWEDRTAETIERALVRGRETDGFSHFGTTLSMIVTVALTAFGALAIIEQQMTIGALIGANILASRAVAPFTQLIGAWRGIAAYRQAVGRLKEVFALPEDNRADGVELAKPSGALRIEGLRYAFSPLEALVLDGIGVAIRPGGLHALVGPNGSGKSTFLKLLAGLYTPSAGRITIDGIDLTQVADSQRARWIALLEPDPFLFSGTIRDNIAIADPAADDAAVVAAAERVGVHEAIVDLPNGYMTDVGERGARLSTGLRQRIALARAAFSDPAVLLLDEPTSALDQETERAVIRALTALATTHTVIVATHSPALIAACSDVVVLQRGRVTAVGPVSNVSQLAAEPRNRATAGASPSHAGPPAPNGEPR